MKRTSKLKMIFAATFLALPLASLKAEDKSKSDYNPDFLIFSGEMRTYIEKANELNAITVDKDNVKDKIVKELQLTGRRLARVYFAESAQIIQNDLNTHLATTLKENTKLKSYFVFLGNAFADQAVVYIQRYQNHQKNIRIWTSLGGAAIGLALGGGYLVFKMKSAAATAMNTAALTPKDYLLAAGAVAVGTGIGIGVGTKTAANLPMDNAVTNSKEFTAKYPHGEDFIGSFHSSSDLSLLQSEFNLN
ncbi:MAG: hypothetical protein JWQ35_1805 [Bacteriovoracaceae bacterium]|nr:hypothetical protein [Bacteriovoracaceae bacterium]